jgi:ketosteroid isomerase-like protein
MGETRQAVERSVEVWNTHDRDGWLQLGRDDVDVLAPGGLAAEGSVVWGQLYDIWHDGFPDNQVQAKVIAEDGSTGLLEATFSGTHTGALKPPSGPEIPPTQKQVSLNFVVVHRVTGGKFTSLHLYFDQVELLSQLGLMPAPTGAGSS